MLKVFLVEDEFVIREGIKNNIDWKAHGYEFCGEAGDGELAYPMIQKLRPDIVITDIRMPFMDGLELSRLIRKELPDTEIIILSGYQEFEYAKEAIKLGVAQYLSKPINGEELLAELDELSAKIEEKRRAIQIRERYLQEMEENNLRERKKLFQELVTGESTVAELLESAEILGIDLSAPWYNIILFKTQSLRHAQDEYSGSLIRIEQELRGLEDGRTVITFDRNLEGKAFLLKADSEEQLLLLQQEYIEKVKDIMEGYEHVRYFGGIGKPVNRLRELPASFEQASHAFAHRYLVQDSRILDSGHMTEEAQKEDNFDIKEVNPKQIDRTRIQEFLKQGTGRKWSTSWKNFSGISATRHCSPIFSGSILPWMSISVWQIFWKACRRIRRNWKHPIRTRRPCRTAIVRSITLPEFCRKHWRSEIRLPAAGMMMWWNR